MSTIDEALKRAQKEKDTHLAKYRGSLSAGPRERRTATVRAGALTLALAVLLLVGYKSQPWLKAEKPSGEDTTGPVCEVSVNSEEPGHAAPARKSYFKASGLHRMGDLQAARRHYQATLSVDPGYVDALNNLGVIYICDGDYQAARRSFEKAIRLDPDYAEPYYNLACLYAIVADPNESLRYLKRAVSINPKVRDWALKDGDLEGLKELPGFHEILSVQPEME